MLTVGSLFAGIGGMELGLEWTGGFKTVWQVEIDEYARRVLEKHWPDAKRFADIRECGAHNLAPVDLICGGFPCPPVSFAGQRRGIEDERWLWPDFAKIIRNSRSRWVLVENVPGILSANAGRAFGEVLRDLALCGYDAEWDCLPASTFGAPHKRYRVFLVAYPNGDRPLQGMAQVQGEAPPCVERQDSTPGNAKRGRLESGIFRCEGPWPEVPSSGHRTSLGTFVGSAWSPERGESWLDDGLPGWLAEVYSRLWGNAVVPQCAEWVGQRILEHAARSG